jgi:peptidoglycan/LPS O-acetylase OafA/YrhL
LKNRIDNLDYLRGIAAFLIMIYHYTGWELVKYSSEDPMARVGVYGVSVFYVLSGLTLFHVYYDKMIPSLFDIVDFGIKRVFRIFPLLWIVIFFTILVHRSFPGYYRLLLNMTGLFGFIKWDYYIATGSWSIGNELVFYALFPLFVYASKRHVKSFMIVVLFFLSLYIVFAFFELSETLPLADQWKSYINPINQVFLFLGGFLIGFIRKSKYSLPVLLVSLALFVLIPASGNIIALVTDWNRLFFTSICFLICLSVYKLPSIKIPPLSFLGEISYSLYLIHPIIYFALKPYLSGIALLAICAIITLACSAISYFLIERQFIKLGKRISKYLAPFLLSDNELMAYEK